MTRRDLILGPPGTGKTYTLMRELERLRSEGYGFGDIGFVSFTRRAMHEARQRARKTFALDEDPEWFRTLHSAFWRRLGLGSGVKITAKDIRAMRDEIHYDISADDGSTLEEGFGAPKSGRPDDELMRASDWARCRMVGPEKAAAESGVDLGQLRKFMDRYSAWKRANGKMDFTDVLEEAVRRGARIPVSVLIVDEAQDLNPLQIRAIEPTIRRAEQVIVAGDDDQAIFTFAGAEPEWLMSLAELHDWSTRKLDQSYRIPRAVHRVASAIIGQNRRRVSKTYHPRDAQGSVAYGAWSLAREVEEALELHGGTAAILARTNKVLRQHIDELFERREVPYILMRGGGPNPLGKPKECHAVATAAKVAARVDVSRTDLIDMLDFVPGVPRGRYIPWGVKTKVKAWPHNKLTADDLDELGLAGLRDMGRPSPVEMLLSLPADIRAWHAAMWARHGKVPEPTCTVSTIHGVKGAEFDTVCIDPTHPAPVERALATGYGRESEARVAYVGVTRAKERLIIGAQRGQFGYVYP